MERAQERQTLLFAFRVKGSNSLQFALRSIIKHVASNEGIYLLKVGKYSTNVVIAERSFAKKLTGVMLCKRITEAYKNTLAHEYPRM